MGAGVLRASHRARAGQALPSREHQGDAKAIDGLYAPRPARHHALLEHAADLELSDDDQRDYYDQECRRKPCKARSDAVRRALLVLDTLVQGIISNSLLRKLLRLASARPLVRGAAKQLAPKTPRARTWPATRQPAGVAQPSRSSSLALAHLLLCPVSAIIDFGFKVIGRGSPRFPLQ